jgi:hypothetical protein
MTRDELVARAQLLYNEPSTSGGISTSDFQTFANVIYKELCRDCRAYPYTDSMNITAGERTYKLNTNFSGIRRGGVFHATYGAMKGPLTLEELTFESATWRSDTGTPTHWYFESNLVGTLGSKNWGIGVYPSPTSTVASGIIVLGWGTPDDFSLGSSSPELPTGVHDYIAWGMCYLAAVRDLDRTGVNKPKLDYFEAAYQSRKKALLEHMIDFGMEGWSLGPPLYMAVSKAGVQ